MVVRRLVGRALALFLALQFLFVGNATADRDDLISSINRARRGFRAVTADDVAEAEAEVRGILAEILGWLGYGQHGQAWQSYLLSDDQFEEFNSSEIGDTQLWHLVYTRVARDVDLFDAEVFQRYRSALKSLSHRIKAYNNPKQKADYLAALTELKELLSASDESFAPAEAARVTELLTKLAQQQQAAKLITAIRQEAIEPNLIIEAPAKLFESSRKISEDYTFQQYVNGAPVEGNGTLKVDQAFSLESGESEVIVSSNVNGTSNSRSLGFGNGVTVESAGYLEFEGTSNISVGIEGVTASGFDTTGTLTTEILGISSNYSGRAAATARQTVYGRQEADRQASQSRALLDLDATFNSRLDELISPMQAAYRRNVYLPLLRHNRLPEDSNFTSDEDRALMQIWFASETQLAAPTSPPWSEEVGDHVRMAIHESAVNNSSALLEGRVRSLVGVLKGKFFEYIAETARPSERIDIRFSDEVAIRGILRDGNLELRLVGKEYIVEGSTYPGMEITLRYHLEDDNSTVLHLSEPPRVEVHVPAGADRPKFGLRGIAMRRILSNALKEHAYDSFDLTELMLPEPFDQLGKFRSQRIVIDDGWIMIEALPLSSGAGESNPAEVPETVDANGTESSEASVDDASSN